MLYNSNGGAAVADKSLFSLAGNAQLCHTGAYLAFRLSVLVFLFCMHCNAAIIIYTENEIFSTRCCAHFGRALCAITTGYTNNYGNMMTMQRDRCANTFDIRMEFLLLFVSKLWNFL